MSISIATDVFCDICGNWIYGGVSDKPVARQARRKAKKAGWKRCLSPISGQMADICPGCIDEYKMAEQNETANT